MKNSVSGYKKKKINTVVYISSRLYDGYIILLKRKSAIVRVVNDILRSFTY